MKWGIIGFGRIAHKFTQSISFVKDASIVAIASKSIDENDDYLKLHPDTVVYRDYMKLLEDPNVEAVYIALPHKMHYPWIIQALDHHKAVLCEKPAVLNATQMKEIKQKAIENDTFFLEALKTKMNRALFHLQKDLALIGKIQFIEANFCSNCISYRGTNHFLYDPEQGGALNDVGSYLFGFVLKIIDSPVKDVKTNVKKYGSFDEHFNTVLTFENGIKAYLEGAIDVNKERYAKIKGEKGEITIPFFNRMQNYTVTLSNHKTYTCEYPFNGDDMTEQIKELQYCVAKGKIESSRHSLDEMIQLADLMDTVRQTMEQTNV